MKAFKWGREPPNYYKLPVEVVPFTSEGVDQINALLDELDNKGYGIIERTPSGGISHGKFPRHQYDLRVIGNSVELCVVGKECYRMVISGKPSGISGKESYAIFKRVCKKHHINIEDYAVKNGQEIKDRMPMPNVQLFHENLIKDKTITHAFHIDLNSAYMSGIAANFPELIPAIDEIYQQRKEKKGYKDVLTHSYGYFQSRFLVIKGNKYALANLSEKAIEYTNTEIEKLLKIIRDTGGTPLATNVDGIWYKGEDLTGFSGCGPNLFQWKVDHKDCTIRFKSRGAYEFIEDGKYYARVRGHMALDDIKPRDQWQWGDIYQKEDGVRKLRIENNRLKIYYKKGGLYEDEI